jgi:hypothetical protein
MFTALTVILATAIAANAASDSTSNPYIPTSISSSCQTFLNKLNTDAALAPCTSALMTASAAYGPGGNATAPTKADITSTLKNICSTSTTATCSQSLITGKLASFYTACGPELTSSSPSPEVKTIYDTFYTLLPLLSAVCSTDDSGDYCLPQVNSTSNVSPALATKARRADTVTAYMPNATTINENNILFLFLDGSLPKAQLCTTCTRNIVSAYISFEANTNYAPGLAQSVLMSGQSAIYSGVVSTCGSDFLTKAVKAAGGLGQSGTAGSSGALSLRANGMLTMLVGALGFAAFVL